jgi:hypothetical protein
METDERWNDNDVWVSMGENALGKKRRRCGVAKMMKNGRGQKCAISVRMQGRFTEPYVE